MKRTKIKEIGISSKDEEFQRVYVKFDYSKQAVSKSKSIPTAKYHKKLKMWSFRVAPEIFKIINEKFEVPSSFMDELMPYREPKPTEIPNLTEETEQWQHQNIAYDFMMNNYCCILAYDMGTGKTLIGSAVARDLAGVNFTLVVCPKSVIPTWEEQVKKHLKGNLQAKGLMNGAVDKRTEKIKELRENHENVLVSINYDAILNDKFKDYMYNNAPDMMILDEVHNAKAPGGKQSWMLTHLAKRIRHRYGLTGTPMPNNILDLYAQFRIIDPGYFGTSYSRFKQTYGIFKNFGNYDKFVKADPHNKDMLMDKFHQAALVAKTDDVHDLPDLVISKRYCTLPSDAMNHHSNIKNELVTMIEEAKDATDSDERVKNILSIENALVKVTRLQQLTSGFLKDDDDKVHSIHKEKQNLVEEILNDVDKNEKVVIFCRFRREFDAIKKVTDKTDRFYFELSGQYNQIDQFKQTQDPSILAVQYQSGSEGIDLTESHYVIYYSPTYSYGQFKQSYRRLLRPGQDKSVEAIFLIAQNTIDERVLQALNNKKNAIDEIINNVR